MAYPDILILRHLLHHPSHGYEIRKRIEESTGIVLNNNSLYPALKRFVDAGAVSMTVEHQDPKPPRHVYELTDVGRELLHDLLAELPAAQAGEDLEFLTRLGQFVFLTAAERAQILGVREQALSEVLARYEDLAARSRGEFWSGAVVDRLTRQARDELGWLRELRAEVDRS